MARKPDTHRCAAFLAAIAGLLFASACGEPPQPAPAKPMPGSSPTATAPQATSASNPELQARLPAPALRKQVRNEFIERIAEEIIWCTPDSQPHDAAARDTAASVLSHLGVLSDACDDTIIWGSLAGDETVNPATARGMLLDPAVWAGCYLSCFVLSGAVSLHQVGDSVVLKVPAKFRDELPAGDYPHPLWHPVDEWASYTRTIAIEFLFTDNRLIAAFRREGDAISGRPAPREWDGNWRWKEGMYLKPRTADFAALFSEDNPHVANLDRAYRDLSPVFTANNCLACHTPDNPAGARSLVVLSLPNQALAARATFAAIMIGESDGPATSTRCTVAVLRGLPHAEAVSDAASRFLEEGDGATEYEWIRLIRRGEDAPRISP